ncbi:hypothetical protein BABINDRAFT_159104 [Babjeviella inositovora NRRL Y-12698]|uniref:Transferrin receptor-like dimerisation domain-containing protein n=1 Tax=Babjeviella inositovora NRRL Y-12698 TaxID=984486 RepID=A0A1E3QY16_9ASCO|nr:uncharacterized protein BABINDRAFT_159104 [Babjeviella inositovora NRRL Y-12698]ODQ82536.1 hypothetical protein BABINDRAFT_159104 [Babjeviella inositovora NRRL Y-12698]
MAGTAGDRVLAKYVEAVFARSLHSIETREIATFLDYPNNDKLSIKVSGDANFDVVLNEGKSDMEYLAFNPNSLGGEFTTNKLVYVNYGRAEDYAKIGALDNALCLVRYGQTHPGTKLQVAEGRCQAVIFFADDPAFPDAIIKDNVANLNNSPGDVLTPGWESSNDLRLTWEQSASTPKVPSVPISLSEAKKLLALLKGGVQFGDWWSGSTGGLAKTKIHFKVKPTIRERHPIWNVIGHIPGREQKSKGIIIGAARDAACYGTMSANTGTVVMLQLVELFETLRVKYDWTPLRSIYFASWDGTEYNLQGAAEHVEQHFHELKSFGYAYIDLSDAVTGTDLAVDAHPALQAAVKEALGLVASPKDNSSSLFQHHFQGNHGTRFAYLNELEKNYVPFNSFAGIPSLEVKFKGTAYPENSCYDNFAFFEKHGDADMTYHTTLVRVLARLAIKLVDMPFIPYDLHDYVGMVDPFVQDIDKHAKSHGKQLDFGSMNKAIRQFQQIAKDYHLLTANWKEYVYGKYSMDDPIDVLEPVGLSARRMHLNERLTAFEKYLLATGGNSRRPAYRHMLFGALYRAPDNDAMHQYGEGYWATFPVVRDAMERGDWEGVQRALNTVANALSTACEHFFREW